MQLLFEESSGNKIYLLHRKDLDFIDLVISRTDRIVAVRTTPKQLIAAIITLKKERGAR